MTGVGPVVEQTEGGQEGSSGGGMVVDDLGGRPKAARCPCPTRAASGRGGQDRWKDTTGNTDGKEGCPKVKRDALTEGGCAARGVGRRVGERKGSRKADGRVKKGKNVGPGNVGS